MMMISPFRASTTFLPSLLTTLRMRAKRTRPARRVRISFSSTSREAVPPMWNVRIVSCVPGSPMLWAAMIPTASPSSTSAPVERSMP